MQRKSKNLIPALLTLVLVILAFAAGWLQGRIQGYKDKECLSNADFKVYTSAVCRENPDNVECRDKVFVRCGGTEHAINVMNSSGQFGKEWKDYRSSP